MLLKPKNFITFTEPLTIEGIFPILHKEDLVPLKTFAAAVPIPAVYCSH